MTRLLRDYSLSLALAALFIVSWLVQTAAGWFEFVSEQTQHGQQPAVFGPDGYVWMWAESMFENWQSEFLQLFTFVVLTAFLDPSQEPRVEGLGRRDAGAADPDRARRQAAA